MWADDVQDWNLIGQSAGLAVFVLHVIITSYGFNLVVVILLQWIFFNFIFILLMIMLVSSLLQ